MTALANWSGNYTYRAPRIHRPAHDRAGAGHRGRVGPGRRHWAAGTASTTSPTRPGDLIDLTGLPADLEVTGDGTVTVTAGTSYGRLATALQEHSLALPNLASLPHISIAGAVATGTHGSGVANRALGASVSGIELIRGDGELVTLRRGRDEDFAGAVVGLGALGIVTRVTLDVEPAFEVRQDVFEDLPWSELEAHFDDIVSSAYSVSLFSNLQGPAVSQVWCKSRLTPGVDSAVFDAGGRVRSSFYRRDAGDHRQAPVAGPDR